MATLKDLLERETRTTIALMSGTSMDGVDMVCCRVNVSRHDLRNIASTTVPYPASLHDKVAAIVERGSAPLIDLVSLSRQLGRFYAESVIEFIDDNSLTPGEIDLIGSHGQTICHIATSQNEGGHEQAGTMQIGEAELIAKTLGVTTVSDFRWADLAVGGRGAPLAPIYHQHRFGTSDKVRLVVNIGGIANITLLSGSGEPAATDTGPGNCLSDYLMDSLFGTRFDNDGEIACSGEVSESILERMREDSIFERPLPMALDRKETIDLIARQGISLPTQERQKRDLISTAAALTVWSIKRACDAISGGACPDEVLICGGGVHNQRFMTDLQDTFDGATINSTARYGSDPDFVEAECFAYLANLTLAESTGNLPRVTGATQRVVLGKISLP